MNVNSNERSSNNSNDQKGASSHTMDKPYKDGKGEPAATKTIRCEQCGHVLPTENMALHRAACHTNHHQHQHHVQQQDQQQHHASTSSMMTHLFPNRAASSHDNNNDDALRVNNNASVAAPPPPPPPPPPAAEMVRCATCGKQISALSAMVHEATCHRQHHHQEENELDDDDNNNNINSPNSTVGLQERPYAAEAPVLGQQQQQDETASRTVGTSTSTAGSPSSESAQQQQHQQQEWSCPRCTLLNDPTDHYCQACGYFSGGHRTTTAGSSSSSSSATATATTTTATSPSTIRVEVREMDPRFVTAVTTAASILSWTALGALVAGPVGGAVGGIGAALAAAGAAASGNNRNNNNNNNNNQPPRFTFTSTRITPTGATTTRYVTSSGSSSNNNNNNNSTAGGGGGPLRTVIIRAPDGVFHGGSVADRMILQMLVLNALNQGATDVDQMTYDELLQRFGVGSEHRGASQETIRDLPLTKLDHAAMEALNENQKTCNICLEDLKEGDEMRKLPDCSHVFHRQCIDEWLGRVASCPICKKEIQR